MSFSWSNESLKKKNGTKATPVGDIPAGIIKSTIDIHASFLTKIVTFTLRNCSIRNELKATEVSLIFKKNVNLNKENLREKENVRVRTRA